MSSRLSHRIFLSFIQSRSPLRSLVKNKKLRYDSRKYIASSFIEPTLKESSTGGFHELLMGHNFCMVRNIVPIIWSWQNFLHQEIGFLFVDLRHYWFNAKVIIMFRQEQDKESLCDRRLCVGRIFLRPWGGDCTIDQTFLPIRHCCISWLRSRSKWWWQ